jgi:transcriptional regulator with XRE-family HTH domain
MLEKVANRIRTAREQSGLSQKKLGLALGLSDKAISAYEKGRTYPPVDTLVRIAEELGKPVTYFLSEENEEQDLHDKVSRIEELLKKASEQFEEVKSLVLPKKDN